MWTARRALVCLAVITGSALPAGATPVLVRFHEGEWLQPFAARFSPDARERRDPEAWRYVAREVKGALQVLESTHGFRARFAYSKAFTGFAADLSEEQIEALRYEHVVASIALGGEISPVDQRIPWGVHRVLDLSTAPADPEPDVRSATVFVLDSGIDASSGDLNVAMRVNFADGPDVDCNGHGTHVAGTIGARDNDIGVRGVAPGVRLVSVRVVNCEGVGTTAALLKGIDWIASRGRAPAIVNASLGGRHSAILDAAIRKTTELGFLFVVAAGNDASDACLASPAANGIDTGAITVGAVDALDQEAAFSNVGACVDLWAPGLAILSTTSGAVPGAITARSGTSMAAPHVTGAAALYLSKHPRATPAEIEEALIASSQVPGTASKDGRTILRLQVDRR